MHVNFTEAQSSSDFGNIAGDNFAQIHIACLYINFARNIVICQPVKKTNEKQRVGRKMPCYRDVSITARVLDLVNIAACCSLPRLRLYFLLKFQKLK